MSFQPVLTPFLRILMYTKHIEHNGKLRICKICKNKRGVNVNARLEARSIQER